MSEADKEQFVADLPDEKMAEIKLIESEDLLVESILDAETNDNVKDRVEEHAFEQPILIPTIEKHSPDLSDESIEAEFISHRDLEEKVSSDDQRSNDEIQTELLIELDESFSIPIPHKLKDGIEKPPIMTHTVGSLSPFECVTGPPPPDPKELHNKLLKTKQDKLKNQKNALNLEISLNEKINELYIEDHLIVFDSPAEEKISDTDEDEPFQVIETHTGLKVVSPKKEIGLSPTSPLILKKIESSPEFFNEIIIASPNASTNKVTLSSPNANMNKVIMSSPNETPNKVTISSPNVTTDNMTISSPNATTDKVTISSSNANMNKVIISSPNETTNKVTITSPNSNTTKESDLTKYEIENEETSNIFIKKNENKDEEENEPLKNLDKKITTRVLISPKTENCSEKLRSHFFDENEMSKDEPNSSNLTKSPTKDEEKSNQPFSDDYSLPEKEEHQRDSSTDTDAEEKTSKCSDIFGVRSYLHQFYEKPTFKDPDLYEDDDLRYLLNPNRKRPCCHSIWWKIFVWIGVNFLIFGVIGVLVGYLVPPKTEIVGSSENNIEVLDTQALQFNENLDICKLVGLILFCIGGMTLTIALLFPSFLYQYCVEEHRESCYRSSTNENHPIKSPLNNVIPSSACISSVQPVRYASESVVTKEGLLPVSE